MATPAIVVSAEEYERIALAEPGRRLELHGGRLVEKPPMSVGHDWAQSKLVAQLLAQLDPNDYWVQFAARAKLDDAHFYIPDVCVVPIAFVDPDSTQWHNLNVYSQPLPLVVEIWSPSTGDYDIDPKLPEYQRRGDQEIWRLHPFDRTLITWRRERDGTYFGTTVHGGRISPIALPNVVIDLDALFA